MVKKGVDEKIDRECKGWLNQEYKKLAGDGFLIGKVGAFLLRGSWNARQVPGRLRHGLLLLPRILYDMVRSEGNALIR